MAFLSIPANSPDVGECIYCGTRQEPLRREHAVPYGLNGPWTLLRASCEQCAKITHRFERDTLRGLLPNIRNVLSMQTRRRSQRSSTLPLVLERRGIREVVQVPSRDFPLYLPMPLLPPPGSSVGRPPIRSVSGQLNFIHIAGPSFEQICTRYVDVDFVGARLTFSPDEFGRTIAKIAFCAAIYVLGIAPFINTPIRQIILGHDRCVGHLVGGWEGEPVNDTNRLHAMQVRASGTDVHVILRLFAQFGAPEYHVMLGPADPHFVMSEAWPWK